MRFKFKECAELQNISANTTETGRFYTCPDGSIYPSVTTVLSIIPKEGIEIWKDRVGAIEAEHVLKRAGVRGDAVHNMAEKYLRGEDWKAGAMPATIMSFMPLKKALDENVDNIYHIEAPLYSHYLKCAGRVDLIAEWRGRRAIIDFKTSRSDKETSMIEHYFMQKSAYSVMYEELTGVGTQKLITLMTSDDNPEPLIWEQRRDDWIHKFISVRKQYGEIRRDV